MPKKRFLTKLRRAIYGYPILIGAERKSAYKFWEKTFEIHGEEFDKNNVRQLLSEDKWGEELALLHEGACCFEIGANNATVLMCRSAIKYALFSKIEKILYDEDYIKIKNKINELEKIEGDTLSVAGSFNEHVYKQLKGAYKWKRLKNEAIKHTLIDLSDAEVIESKILKYGNLVAHFEEQERDKIASYFNELFEEFKLSDKQELLVKKPKFIIPKYTGKLYDIVSEKQAEDALNTTGYYVIKILVNYLKYKITKHDTISGLNIRI